MNRIGRGRAARACGQVAQLVERSPEKAGVGGSSPSLATIIPKRLVILGGNFQPTIQPTIQRSDPHFSLLCLAKLMHTMESVG